MKERQKDMIEYIEDYTASNRCPPTIRDIQQKLNIKSTSTVYSDLKVLEDAGLVERVGGGKNGLGSKYVPFYTESYINKIRQIID